MLCVAADNTLANKMTNIDTTTEKQIKKTVSAMADEFICGRTFLNTTDIKIIININNNGDNIADKLSFIK